VLHLRQESFLVFVCWFLQEQGFSQFVRGCSGACSSPARKPENDMALLARHKIVGKVLEEGDVLAKDKRGEAN
jgi:hypothetical protein